MSQKERGRTSVVPIWELPEILLYEIARFAAVPTERAFFLCHKIATLCKASYKSILMEDEKSVGLWDLVLYGDYGVVKQNQESLRASKRLKRNPVDQVRDAHKHLKNNTEIAYYYLWELSASKVKNGNLTRGKLVSILEEYGPYLIMNKTVSSGGTFLVEVCRSRNVMQNTILQCVQELVENRGSLVNIRTDEANTSQLTALCVAAVRGMPKVVGYLLSKGSSTKIKCSGRFRLHSNPRKSLRCNDACPLEFAQKMVTAEKEEGAKEANLKDLKACIKQIQAHEGLCTS
jgi:hypothetical protein